MQDAHSDFEQAGWERAAGCYEATFAAATRNFLEPLVAAAGAGPGVRLLDLASGTGALAAVAAAHGAEVIGIDFAPAMLREARRLHPGLDFREADATALPFADAEFDAVAMSFGIHHLSHPERCIAEASRVLRPGGRFAYTLWVERADNPAWRIVGEVIAAHGRTDVSMPATNEAAVQLGALVEATRSAGFDEVAGERVERVWRLPGDADLTAIFASTVKMGTLIQGQTPAALQAIRRAVAAALSPYRSADGLAIPIRAYLVRALKPRG
jgi:SAM-dependent methyltransferase